MNKIKLTMLAALLTSGSALAINLDSDTWIGGGLNVDTFKEDLPGNQDLKDDLTLAPTLGVKTTAMWENVGFRSGLFFEWKKFEIDAPDEDPSVTAYYLAVPLNLQFNIADEWAIFGGIAPRVLLADSCEDCQSFDEDSDRFVNYTNLGISWAFDSKWSLDVSFAHGISDNYDDITTNTAQALLLYKL